MLKNRKKIIIILSAIAVILAGIAVFIVNETTYIVPVLMYHSIDYDDMASKLSVSPEEFARQMEFLRKNNYNIVPVEKAAYYISKKAKPPSKTIAITFDDGFENNYLYAYPVLKKYNIPATIYVIIDRVGTPGFLNWAEIKEMSDSGVVTIGSHTKSHIWLLESDERFLKDELDGSRKTLEEKLGKKAELFCYPMGAFDAVSRKAAEKAGYTCAVATNPKGVLPEDVYAIKRIKISRSSYNLFIFWGDTTRIYTWFKRVR